MQAETCIDIERIVLLDFIHRLVSQKIEELKMSDPQLTAHCIYNIPCECSRSYVGETGRPLSVRIGEHKFNLKNGLLDKSKLAQHAFEEGHQISWNKAKILHLDPSGQRGSQ
jgi:hypothetical protein